MSGRTPARCVLFVLLCGIFAGPLRAQYVCDFGNGPLNSAPPAGVTTAEIIEAFATHESALKDARDRYGYALDVNVETLNGNAVTGTFHQASEVAASEHGERLERMTFAPQSTLSGMGVTKGDLDDIRDRLPLILRAQELSHYSIQYAGSQRVDQLETYVFDVAAKDPVKEPQRFHGRVWVETHDLTIVKTCGKTRGDERGGPLGRNAANLSPTFVTYREQIDGKYWFITYARADELLNFPTGSVHMREVIKYSNYRALPPK